MMSDAAGKTDPEVIHLGDARESAIAPPPPPPPPPPPLPPAVPKMGATRPERSARQSEMALADDLVSQARSVLEAACVQVDDMIGSARAIIAKAEAEAEAIIDEARATAQRITGDARTQAASFDRSLAPTLQSADPPAPQKKSFAAMWARAGDEVGSIDEFSADEFFVGDERSTQSDLAKRLSPRWRRG